MPSLVIIIADAIMVNTATTSMGSLPVGISCFSHAILGTGDYSLKAMLMTSGSESFNIKAVQTADGFQIYLWGIGSSSIPTWLKNARWVAYE